MVFWIATAALVLAVGNLIASLALFAMLRESQRPARRAFERIGDELRDDVQHVTRRTIEEAERILDQIDHRVTDVRREQKRAAGRKGGEAKNAAPARPYNDADSYRAHLEQGGAVDVEFEAQLGLPLQ